ncbi:MAG: WXG100 family type VII secretion target [Anaerolineae bacterium]|jgi:WXG100 family type VII secretion target|nr:WXG100 family type VII secretion target [Anaerolineae bacterium]
MRDLQIHYEQLLEIQTILGSQAESLNQFFTQFRNYADQLSAHWEGEGANEFYQKLEESLYPRLKRLCAAFEQAQKGVGQIVEIYQTAEDQALDLFQFSTIAVAQISPTPTPEGPITAKERSEAYASWHHALRERIPPILGIYFFDAASVVTKILSMAENEDAPAILGEFFINSPNERVRDFLDRVGARLYEANQEIYQKLQNGEYFTEDGRLISPYTGEPVESKLDWDIHMVFTEQEVVQDILNDDIRAVLAGNLIINPDKNPIENFADYTREIDEGVNRLLWVAAVAGESNSIMQFYLGDTTFINWAMEAIRPQTSMNFGLSFSIEDHRRALGIALVFQKHGRTQEEYNEYMARVWNSNRPPPVSEVLGE